MSEVEAKKGEESAAPAASEGRARRGPRGEKTCYNCGTVRTLRWVSDEVSSDP